MHLVLTFFHQIKGPSVYLSYPEIVLEEDIINSLIKFFDLEINESFFEIVLITKRKKIINLHFQIPSQWARGKKEFVMLSLLMKKEYESEQFYAFLVDASYRILNTYNVYKAFYKFDDFRDDTDIEIDLTFEQIKKILINCLTSLITGIEEKIKGVNKKEPFPFS